MLRNLVKFVPLAALLPLAMAEGTVQDLWNSPQYPDYTTNYTAGTTIEISWQHALASQFQFYCEDCDIRMWISGVNLNKSTSYEWTINLDDADVEASTEWTFRFLPADISWGDNQEEISSAKFHLLPRSISSSLPTTTSTTTSTSSSTSTSTTTTTSTPDATPASENATDGLSTGAKAGIGIGVGAGAIILTVLAFLLCRRIKALPNTTAVGPEGADGDGGYSQVHQGYFVDSPVVKATPKPVSARVAPMSELVGDHAGEMDAGVDAQPPPVELDATGLYTQHGR
ncbi:hypothetical protein BDW71DRAFT_208802 [Aspergillus fruticulosus]